MYRLLDPRWAGAAALVALTTSHVPVSSALGRCEEMLSSFGNRLVDARCTESADLTTSNPATTPAECLRARARARYGV
jgi:hypothetical protein